MNAPVLPGAAAGDGRRGILWMLLTMFLFASINAVAKYLALTYPVPQVVWARYAFHLLLLLLLLRASLPRVTASRRLGLQLTRSLLMVTTTAMFFTGIHFIPLADAGAIMFVAPVLVTALSVPLLGEPVGPRRWAAVVFGFVGALIIIRPGASVMHAAAFLPIGAACLHALYQIITRKVSAADAPLTSLVYTALIGVIVSSAVVPFFWTAPDAAGWALMVLLGMLGGGGHFAMIKAFEAAPAATVTPYGYTILLWATLFGFVLFADLPDHWTVVGALVIVLSGLYIFHREQRRRGAIGPGTLDLD